MRSEALLRTDVVSPEVITEIVYLTVGNTHTPVHLEVAKSGDVSVKNTKGRLLFAGVWRLSYVHYFGESTLDWNVLDKIEGHVRKIVSDFYPHLSEVDRELQAMREVELGKRKKRPT